MNKIARTFGNVSVLIWLLAADVVWAEGEVIVTTPDAKWVVAEDMAAEALDRSGLQPLSIDISPTKIKPLLQTRRQFLKIALGADDVHRLLKSAAADKAIEFQQVISGIPGAFSGMPFDEIRRRFDPRCVWAAGQLKRLLDEIAMPSPAEVLHDIDEEVKDTHKTELIAAIRLYDRSCLREWRDVLPNSISRGLGVLVANGAPFCSATLVGDRQLLTARHCFIKSVDGTAAKSMELLEKGSVIFMPLDANTNGRIVFSEVKHEQMKKPPIPQDAYGITSDLLYLSLQEGLRDRALSQSDDPMNTIPGDLVYIVGYNSLLTVLKPISVLSGFPTDLDPHVRLASPETCAIIATSPKGCLFHSCQTAGGTSGAALVRQRDHLVIGVHTGSGHETDECPMGDLPISLLNVATAVRQL